MRKKQMKILKVPKSKVENFVNGGEGGGDNGIDKGHYKKSSERADWIVAE